MPGANYDKSTRNLGPPAQTIPRLYRPGFIANTLTKYYTNSGPLEGYVRLMLCEVTGVIPTDPDAVKTRVDIAIVSVGEVPGNEDYIARGLPLVGNEVLEFMGGELLMPAAGELWLACSAANTVTAYIQAREFV